MPKINFLSIPQNFNSNEYYRFKVMNDIVNKILSDNKRRTYTILDVGCGDGQFMKYIRDKAPKECSVQFIGIEKFIKNKFFDFKKINSDLEDRIKLKNNTIDIVIAGEIIEHVENTDGLIKELIRITKKNGSIILSTPNLASYFNRILLMLGNQPYHSEVSDVESGFGQDILYKILGRPKLGNKTAGHLRIFTYNAIIDFFKYYKLNIKEYYPIYFSYYRKDNKNISLIKLFFKFDQIISILFPKLASGMVFHLIK